MLRENVTVRLEPYCDIGLLTKPDGDRYEYQVAPRLKTFMEKWGTVDDTDHFLGQRFFATAASCWNINASAASEEEATAALMQANDALKSELGYAPIVDMGLLAGLRLLCRKRRLAGTGTNRTTAQSFSESKA